MILNFKSFNESMNQPRIAAGIAIKYMDTILLVHATNSSWHKNNLSIPKGKIEKGEDPLEAAIRELKEETGIIIKPDHISNQLDLSPMESYKYDDSGKLTGQLIYFSMVIQDLSEIDLIDLKIPRSQLQLEEIDWAGFVPIKDAYGMIHRSQMIILDRLS
jgi:8-oxo-dGTP pyrophosphatase MutT (NUDIX family)